MTSYIFFHINTDKLDEYSDATIYHSANNWTIPILFKNCDFYINYEDIQYRFYVIQKDNIINTSNNIQFKIKNKDTYILLNDSKFLTFNDNGNINNIIITTEENNLYNGINHININDNIIKIFRNEFILFEGHIINYNLNGKGIEYYKDNIKKYEGEYKDGQRNGKGILYYSFYQKNQYNGYNSFKWYDGEWYNGKMHGTGTQYYDDGTTIQYKGLWKNGKMNGNGIYKCSDKACCASER